MIPSGSQVTFSNLDAACRTRLPSWATRPRSTRNVAEELHRRGTQSKAGTDISTTGFTTGTLTPGSNVADVCGVASQASTCSAAQFHYVTHGMRTVIIVH